MIRERLRNTTALSEEEIASRVQANEGADAATIEEGDLIAVMDAGAYGFSMSHQFCTRPKAAEILIDGEKLQLIRKRETIEDIFSKCEVSQNLFEHQHFMINQ